MIRTVFIYFSVISWNRDIEFASGFSARIAAQPSAVASMTARKTADALLFVCFITRLAVEYRTKTKVIFGNWTAIWPRFALWRRR